MEIAEIWLCSERCRARIKSNLRNLEFLEDIARIRKAENLTQTEVSKRSKISQKEISRIERGKKEKHNI